MPGNNSGTTALEEAGMSGRTGSRVAVLMGGVSVEREVSLVSGKGVAAALRGRGHDVREIDAGPDLVTDILAWSPDVVFNALHGRWGEDGCVQGLLEWLRIPYTHSGVLASALAMDKVRAKDAFRAAGLPVADSLVAARDEVRSTHLMTPPYVVKPINEGSSIGIAFVTAKANTPARLGDDSPDQVMVERYIPGRELTTAVLDDRPLAVTDIFTDGWYSYHAKYDEGGSSHMVPADIPREIEVACLDYALRAHRVLRCRGLSRTDFRWDETRGIDGLYLLETNTQPGMTPTSLAPEQAAVCGMSFADVACWLLEDASCDR